MSNAFETWKKLGLSAAIVIVLNVFFYAGLDSFYPQPDYNDYCPVLNEPVKSPAATENGCHLDGGNWVSPAVGSAYCDMSYVNAEQNKCWELYDQAQKPHQRNSFIVFTILGLLALLAGLEVKTFPMAVGRGFMYGGVVSMFLGASFYWEFMEDYFRFIVSGVVLAVLVVVGVRKLKD